MINIKIILIKVKQVIKQQRQHYNTLLKSKNYDITGIMEDFFLPLEKIADWFRIWRCYYKI